ncbi:MAG: dihydrolipoamide acetyltransferase family protein [Candidatus Hodarchaeales archaeon]|jgi:pyruvate dehydrogenase E2 component (dihydrolipoamide acetyltransferase)
MSYEFKFSDPGEGVHEGEILQWHVKEGDIIKNEQLLVEILTEKVTVELASPVAGTILSIEKEEGEIIKVGDILVKINTNDKPLIVDTDSLLSKEKDDSLFTAAEPFEQRAKKGVTKQISNSRPLTAPSIRRKAREKGINLQNVQGSGPSGRITQNDFEKFISKFSADPLLNQSFNQNVVDEDDEIIPLRGLRRNISNAMRHSKDTAAHYSYFEEVDMTNLDTLKDQANKLNIENSSKLSYLPLVIKCLIPALKKYPYFNSSLNDEKQEITLKKVINIGIAVHTDAGLIVPVVKNVEKKGIWQLQNEISELVEKARAGKLSLTEVTGGTFTITSVGNLGGFAATPIIRWPEVAILGLMRKKLRPVVVKNQDRNEIVIRPIMMLSLTIDHKVVDGAIAAMFTNTLVKYMENPSLLLLSDF